MDEYQIDRVDYLKMDIEGAEADILPLAANWASRVDCLKVELHAPATYESCAAWLSSAGYHCQPDDKHQHCLVATRRPIA